MSETTQYEADKALFKDLVDNSARVVVANVTTAMLREQQTAALTRLQNGLKRLSPDVWVTLDWGVRSKIHALLHELLDQAIDAAENCRELPKTTACVCLYCREVLLPNFLGSYNHCGKNWRPRSSDGFVGLPRDFWNFGVVGTNYDGVLKALWATEGAA